MKKYYMKSWIHFIGSKYYTIQEFVFEAKGVGVSRKIPVKFLKKMTFGDTVYCFQGKKKYNQKSVMFGYFVVENIFGSLPNAAINELKKKKLASAGGNSGFQPNQKVHRGCGSYYAGQTYGITGDVSDIAEVLEKHDCKEVMVGGAFTELMPKHIASVIPFQRGFRLFNHRTFFEDYKQQIDGGGKRITVKGHHYAKDYDFSSITPKEYAAKKSNLVEVLDYKRKEEIEREIKLDKKQKRAEATRLRAARKARQSDVEAEQIEIDLD